MALLLPYPENDNKKITFKQRPAYVLQTHSNAPQSIPAEACEDELARSMSSDRRAYLVRLDVDETVGTMLSTTPLMFQLALGSGIITRDVLDELPAPGWVVNSWGCISIWSPQLSLTGVIASISMSG